MISKLIKNAFDKARQKKWNKIYIAIDVHDTILYSNYDKDNIPVKFCPGAIITLQYLTKRSDVVLILYTCSWENEIKQYLNLFESNGIHFEYVNENPEVTSVLGLGCYDKKMYFNILFEDKAGFDCENDWYEVYVEFVNCEKLI